MKKYMILAKNDYNEEIFYTDIKAEAKSAFDRMMDKYFFVKAFCYNEKVETYQDITEINAQSVYRVQTYTGLELIEKEDCLDFKLLNEENYEFTNKLDALTCIIHSMKAGRKYKLYKNGGRDWSV
jgi:hypothetical protein|nr:MAG TPA: hypothetical protein [Caudoviricetes sp.]